MEFAVAAMTSIGNTITGALGSLGTAFTGTTGALGAPAIPGLLTGGLGSTVSSILAGGATVASVLNAQRAGEEKAWGLELQALDADTEGSLEAIRGTERRSSMKAALAEALGERDVAAAASGVDLSFGTPAIARERAIRDGERALAIDSGTEDFRVARLRERSVSLRRMAASARSGGLGRAAALGLEGAARIARRG